jgi:hypothetical protein
MTKRASVNATGAHCEMRPRPRPKNTVYFNELNDHVNEKIRTSNASR